MCWRPAALICLTGWNVIQMLWPPPPPSKARAQSPHIWTSKLVLAKIWLISQSKLHPGCLFVKISCVCSPGAAPGPNGGAVTDPELWTGSFVCVEVGRRARVSSGLWPQRKRMWFGGHGAECAVNWWSDWDGLLYVSWIWCVGTGSEQQPSSAGSRKPVWSADSADALWVV